MKIGIDLGGSHIGVGVIDNKNFIVEKVEKRLLAKDKKDVKNIIESYIIKNVKEFSSKYKIIEIGIAVPGTIKKEQILKSVNLGVREYKLVENLKKEKDIKKAVEELQQINDNLSRIIKESTQINWCFLL